MSETKTKKEIIDHFEEDWNHAVIPWKGEP